MSYIDIPKIVQKLAGTWQEIGLKVNINEIKIIASNKKYIRNIMINHKVLERIDKYNYQRHGIRVGKENQEGEVRRTKFMVLTKAIIIISSITEPWSEK